MIFLSIWVSQADAGECRVATGSACPCYIAQNLTFFPVAPGIGSVVSPISADRLVGFEVAGEEYSNTLAVNWSVSLSPMTTPSTDVDMGYLVAEANGISELVELSDASWALLGFSVDLTAIVKLQVSEPTCEILSADIYYRSAPAGLGWTNAMPSETISQPLTELSFVQTMLHELGHAAGLAHYNQTIGLMDATIHAGGNAGIGADAADASLARLNADEQYTLSDLYPGGSVGREFLLYKFERIPKASNPSPGQGGKSREIWTEYAAANPLHTLVEGWTACPGGRLTVDPPPPSRPYAAMQSSVVETVNVTVKFGLSETATVGSCAMAPQVAYNDDVVLTTGVPFLVYPVFDDPNLPDPVAGWCIPTGTVPGMYHPCAFVEDADSTDYDDEVYADKQFEVMAVGPSCCRAPASMIFGCDGVLLPTCP